MPKSYPPELRHRVIELCRAGGRPRKLADDLGVSEATIYRWIAQDEVDHGLRPGLHSAEQAELSAAKARMRELEAELELTRKASALFSEEKDRPAPKGSTR
ncbi:MAG TPA: helix-turn-helix domain-containing protein [Solirubrobacteraceae bacterium]|nr:helix-turn-helix domain-containing protein [Solirubrobacteraceae bacterium]